MGFFDLNIPYHESDRHVIDKRSLQDKRLDLTLKAMELGYTGVAYNRTIKGVMSDSQRCTTTLFPISKITPSSSSWFLNSVKFHRQLLNVPVTAPFRQYTRLTVVVDTLSQVAALNAGNPVLRSYDLVAVRPMNQSTFDQACQMAEVDMVAIEFSDRLPFRLKQPMVKAAIKRGVIFEITYSGLIIDPQSRQQMMSNSKLLVDWTKGKNLIFSSAAPTVTELRGPQDVANLVCLLGLTMERARAAISKNCRTLLAGALRKRQFYKGAIKIEEIPSGKRVDPDQYPFDDWLKWDPLSSGEGDLLLDEMEKSFVEANNVVAKTFKPVNFTSAMNGLPVHGFQVKDVLSLTKNDLEPLRVNDLEPAAMDVDKTDSVCEKNAEQCVDPLLEECDVLGNQASNATIVNTLMPATREGDAYVDSVEIGHQASRFENTDCEPWQTDNKSNHKQPVSISDEKLVDHLLAANFVPSTAQFEGIQSQIVLPDKKPGIINDDHTSVELSCPLDRSNLSAAKLEESCVDIRCDLDLYTLQSSIMDRVAENSDAENRKEPHQASESAVMPEQYGLSAVQSNPSFVENRSDLDVCADEVGAFDQTLDKNDSERNEGLSLPSFDGSKQDSLVTEKCQITTDRFIALDDALSTEEFSSPTANVNASISDDLIDDGKQNDSVIGYQGLGKSQAGKGKRKRKSPLLFPFKRFLNQTHFKRKARK